MQNAARKQNNGDVYSPINADNTVKRDQMDRRQTDLLHLLL